MKVRLFLALAFALAALPFAACTQRAAHADCLGGSDCRPPLALTTLDGTRLGDDTLHGHAMLVNFWATWCAPCAKEIPGLQAVYERHRAQGFTIIGMLAGDESTDVNVKLFARARGVSYPIVRSGPEIERRFKVGDALPTSFLYDRSGRLVKRFVGDIEEAELEAEVRKLLE